MLTSMSGASRVDLLLESDPSLLEFVRRPCVPGRVDDILPLNVFLRIQVQARNPEDMINIRQNDLSTSLPMYKYS